MVKRLAWKASRRESVHGFEPHSVRHNARMLELVDMQDLESCACNGRGGSTPPSSTKYINPTGNNSFCSMSNTLYCRSTETSATAK